MTSYISYCTICALTLSLAIGCGKASRQDLPPDGQPGGLALPVHETSALTEYVLSGKDAELRSNGVLELGSALSLPGNSEGFEYALYRFNPGIEQPDSVSVVLEEVATTGAWIGVADYAAGSWEIGGPYTKQKTLAVDDPRFQSPAGNIWVVVLVRELSAVVNALSVRTLRPDNQAPSAVLQAAPASGTTPLLVQFDASGSSDPDGSILEYAWDFDGNGTYEEFSDEPVVSHEYATPGIRTVKVRVMDDQLARSTATSQVSVNAANNAEPTADYSRNPDSGDVPLTVSFDAAASDDPDGTIVRYDWDFDGNGTWDAYDSGAAVAYTYTSPGAFIPVLRVTDNLGAQDLKSRTVNVGVPGNASPVAVLDASPSNGNAPLSVNLDASSSSDSDGSIVRYDWDFNGDGSWEVYDGPETVDHTFTAGAYTAKLRVTDNSGAQDIANAVISVNALPQPHFSFSAQSVAIGETVTLDGVASSDPDGSIVKYEWDLDGNGSFETDSLTTNYAQTSFTTAGIRSLGLRVTDDASPGATATYFKDLLVSGWAPAVDPENLNHAYHPSMALVNGKAAIAYHDYQANRLKYIRASDTEATAWDTPVIVDDPADLVGAFPSLVVVAGRPAISYYNITDNDLYYVRAEDPNGTSWGSPVGVVVAAEDVGENSSMAVVNGNPAISYFDDTNNDMYFVRASDAAGTTWGSPVGVYSIGSSVIETSLAVVDGMPAIAFRGHDGLGITCGRFVRATNANGSAWGSAVTLLTDGQGEALSPSLAVINGVACVAFRQANGDNLVFYRANNVAATSWAAGITIASGNVGTDRPRQVSLCALNGLPAISFFRNGSGTQFIAAVDSQGSIWGAPETAISGYGQGGISLLPVSTGLGLATTAYPGAEFKFARYY